MKIGIVQIWRDEYREGHLCVQEYKVTFLGIPVYRARFTTTNNEALRKLTILKETQLHIKGFLNQN